MLVTGKTRILSVTGLLILGIITIVTWSYNPGLTEDSSQAFRKWRNEQAWLGSKGDMKGHYIPNPQTELETANPDPGASWAAVEDKLETKPEEEHKEEYGEDHASDAMTAAPGKEESNNGQPAAGLPPMELEDEHHHAPMSEEEKAKAYHQIFSQTTKSGSYFNVVLSDDKAINPNIIPHPVYNDTWIVVAQGLPREDYSNGAWSVELVCNAKFKEDGNLECLQRPRILPIAATSSDNCDGDLKPLVYNVGPHDARVLWGPDIPYIIYGSQSQFNCFGQWAQDFRLLVEWPNLFMNMSEPFERQTELQRPAPLAKVEKNYFFFWDLGGKMYAHYDTAPKRAFAQINGDGTAGEDLAPQARPSDDLCWKKHLDLNPLPDPSEAKSSIHQATNSLSITFCKRKDPNCQPNFDNTFVMQIYQHKIGNGVMHARYEPYVMLFRQFAPFEMNAISAKPLWIAGRQSKREMLYATSISWKANDSRYHGYLDDVLFLNFGIEDGRFGRHGTGSIDVLSSDLVGDLMTC